jgi:predicted nucleotidyltransferase
MTVSEIKSALFPVFKEYGVHRAVLFGSYAKGGADDSSDVDLLVDSGLRGFAFTELMEDLFMKLNRPVDIIDTAHIVKESKIEREIRQTGVVIYEKSTKYGGEKTR